MPSLREEQKPESLASRDCHLARLLFVTTGLSVGEGLGCRGQSGLAGVSTRAGSRVSSDRIGGGKLKGEIALDEAYCGGN